MILHTLLSSFQIGLKAEVHHHGSKIRVSHDLITTIDEELVITVELTSELSIDADTMSVQLECINSSSRARVDNAFGSVLS